MIRFVLFALLFRLLMTDSAISSAEPLITEPPVTDVVQLSSAKVTESSGLASSGLKPGHFWTHNDSGDEACLYAFNRNGKVTGQVNFDGIDASDWEDMASYNDAGVARLLVADCGDNDRRRRSIKLYALDEPDPSQSTTLSAKGIEVFTVTYPDGPRDCEAVAVDQKRRQIVLVTKSFLPAVGVYTIPLPPRVAGNLRVRHEAVATRIATISIPMVTAMDIDPKSGSIWLATYVQAFRYRDDPNRQLAQLFKETPETIELPRWRQIEAFAVDASQRAWLTSEGAPMPLGRIRESGDSPEGQESKRP